MKRKIMNIIYLWVPVFLYALLIFLLSSRPYAKSLSVFPGSDKIVHIVEYSILGFLLCRALKFSFISMNNFWIMSVSIAVSALYGISDEIHQFFVPYRTADALDAIADFGGSFLGVICCMRYYYKGYGGKN